MRNSTAAHTGWLLLLLLLAITATTIWLFAGAQWDQSSIFRPTVQFLSFFGDFWQFLAVHSGTKAQFSVPLCNFCHFLSFFAVFWQCCWPNKKGRALALLQELCLLLSLLVQILDLWNFCCCCWGNTGAQSSQLRIFLFHLKSRTCPKFCCCWGSTGAQISQLRIFFFFFLPTIWGTTGSRQTAQIKKGRALALKSKNSAFEALWAADDLSSWQDKSSSQRAESQ